MGEHKWLTVVSEEEPDGVEVLLEPMGFAPAKVFQKALKDAGIPLTNFMLIIFKANMSDWKNWG